MTITFFVHTMSTQNFKRKINVCIFIIMWRVRLNLFCSGNQ